MLPSQAIILVKGKDGTKWKLNPTLVRSDLKTSQVLMEGPADLVIDMRSRAKAAEPYSATWGVATGGGGATTSFPPDSKSSLRATVRKDGGADSTGEVMVKVVPSDLTITK